MDNIFQIRVKCDDRVCNLIIDSDNNMNVVSQRIVDILKLPMEKHPHAYEIAWVNDYSIPVTKRCLLKFNKQGI